MIIGAIDGAGQVGTHLKVRDWNHDGFALEKIYIAGLCAPAPGIPGPPSFILTYDAPAGSDTIMIYPPLVSWEAGKTLYGNFSTVKESAPNGALITTTKPEPQGEEGA